jgi:UDPglucose 6-dehydrogenase
MVDAKSIFNCEVIQSLDDFKFKSEIILTNRFDNLLEDVQDKVFTRDVFGDH